jgi:hypothetical protein
VKVWKLLVIGLACASLSSQAGARDSATPDDGTAKDRKPHSNKDRAEKRHSADEGYYGALAPSNAVNPSATATPEQEGYYGSLAKSGTVTAATPNEPVQPETAAITNPSAAGSSSEQPTTTTTATAGEHAEHVPPGLPALPAPASSSSAKPVVTIKGSSFADGMRAYGAHLYPQALAIFSTASRKNYGDAKLHYYMGLCYQRMNQSLLARQQYQWVAEYGPHDLRDLSEAALAVYNRAARVNFQADRDRAIRQAAESRTTASAHNRTSNSMTWGGGSNSGSSNSGSTAPRISNSDRPQPAYTPQAEQTNSNTRSNLPSYPWGRPVDPCTSAGESAMRAAHVQIENHNRLIRGY